MNKLRRAEPSMFDVDMKDCSGRRSFWLSPSVPFHFQFFGGRPPRINRESVEELMLVASGPHGLDVIVRHNWPSVDPDIDVEGYLFAIAIGLDISGARPDALPEAFLREVLVAHPRGTLAEEFGACVVDQAERKPDTSARRLVDGGLVRKLAENPLERV
ncbi:hypothetical protein [Microbacterium deminutum]|uniref:DUF7882 domain-containing protein n=1 Tax=Microbacterium deminutum TaxID=344164 RepID=A0ABP5CU57_9MICO